MKRLADGLWQLRGFPPNAINAYLVGALQSLAVGLGPTEALLVGRMTAGFPLVTDILPLPESFAATGVTRSFWDSERDPSQQAAA